MLPKERSYRIWQRDPLAILIDSIEKPERKLDYIHLNPLNERWNLADDPENYYWSSAKFYETGKNPFFILFTALFLRAINLVFCFSVSS